MTTRQIVTVPIIFRSVVSGRTFYISRYHNGCAGDIGWVSIQVATPGACNGPVWERAATVPVFRFSAGSSYTQWDSGRKYGVFWT